MFPVQLSFVLKLLNVPTGRIPNFSLKRVLLFRWLQLFPVLSKISCSTFAVSLSVHRRLYFSFFSASFYVTFLSTGTATLSVVLIIISVLFAVPSLSVCTAWFHKNVTSSQSHIARRLSFRCSVLCTFSDVRVNTQQLCRLSFLAKRVHPKVR